MPFFLSSCSIKEVRDDCPCYLILDYEFIGEVLPESWEDGLRWDVHTFSGELVDEGVGEIGNLPSDGQMVIVPKTDIRSSVWCVDGGVCSPHRGLYIREGEQSPRIFLHSRALDARCNMLRDTVVLHKQYANVDISIIDMATGEVTYELEGGSCGFESDGTVRAGKFRTRLSPDREGFCHVRVPRQTGGFLALNVYESGVLTRIFNVGQAIKSGGYDWTAPDLEDISLEVDYVSGKVVYSLSLWSETVDFSIVF